MSFFVGERISDAKAYLEQCSAKYDKAINNIVVVRLLVGSVLKGRFPKPLDRLIIRKRILEHDYR
jgi:hypothetical protein